ncbi:DMT family transporter [Alkalihalobacillus sp. CinArs1]|uniref:DMT family transporter n=1 Tax=Alkalihalobacillus sp. CinArs1 TaxID=2995314 RepID=UPI0022DE2095|nr:multidrug efflux SMR transporter [Alkalihalobacillus sp. CinArs1]
MKHFVLLIVAILFEVIGATFMKFADGFTNAGYSVIVFLSYALALTFYIILTRDHDLGITNALWSGGGTVTIAVIGIALFDEATTTTKLIGITLIVIGIVGLNTPRKHAERGGQPS